MDRKKLMAQYTSWKKNYPTGKMTKADFKTAAVNFLLPEQTTDSFIDRLFNAFDEDNSGEIDFGEFLMAVTLSLSSDPEDKLKFCFKCMDIDNSGFLSKDEVLYAVKMLFANRPALKRKVAESVNTPEKVVDQVFNLVDKNGDQQLSVDELIDCMNTEKQKFEYLGLNFIFLNTNIYLYYYYIYYYSLSFFSSIFFCKSHYFY